MKRWKSAAARRICQLTGQQTVEGAVIEIARRLTNGLENVPIELNRIFPRVRIRACRSDPNLIVSGELRQTDDNGFEIVVAEEQASSRQRFTIAHEIAHAVFEHTGGHCPRRGRELERICDLIASELLMPSQLFCKSATSDIDLAVICSLAKTFDVSVTSVAIRCSDLFGTLVSQIEDDDIRWWRGRVSSPVRSLKQQLKSVSIEAINGNQQESTCAIHADNGDSLTLRLQCLPNGEGRTLCVFSSAAIGEHVICK